MVRYKIYEMCAINNGSVIGDSILVNYQDKISTLLTPGTSSSLKEYRGLSFLRRLTLPRLEDPNHLSPTRNRTQTLKGLPFTNGCFHW